MRPHVGAVVRDEDRHVAHDADAALARRGAQRRPLLEEHELLELRLAHAGRELAAGPLEGRGVALDERAVPRVPRRPAVRALEGGEEREVAEPPGVPPHELVPGSAGRGVGLLLERRGRLREQRVAVLLHPLEVHRVRREGGAGRQLRGVEQPLLGEPIERDEQRVARERREGLNRASRRSPSARAAAPATGSGPSPAGSPGTRSPRPRGRRSRTARAARWGEAGCRRRARPRPGYSTFTSWDWLMMLSRSSFICTLTVSVAFAVRSGRM